ncbi:MAG: ABC transporter permease [Rhodoglobus sp.]
MTTTVTTVSRPSTQASRILAVVKLHLANPWTIITLPWMILGIIFAASIVVWLLIHAAAGPQSSAVTMEGTQWSGGLNYIFVYMMVVAVQATSITFPFALGFGVTRRDFYLGSAVTYIGLSAMYALGIAILAEIEVVTNGWGLGGTMFAPIYFGDGFFTRLFIFFVTNLFFFFFGSMFGSIWVRWKANGLVVGLIGLGAIVLGGIALLTLTESWPAFAGFFVHFGFLGSYAWSLVLTVLAGLAGFFILRRATPKS